MAVGINFDIARFCLGVQDPEAALFMFIDALSVT
jgi:hypothetical protein